MSAKVAPYALSMLRSTVVDIGDNFDVRREDMVRDLATHDIEAELILDAAIGYIMEKIDLVLVGAEGVVASGGIINKVGVFNVRCYVWLTIICKLWYFFYCKYITVKKKC